MCGWHICMFLECVEADILKVGGLLLIALKNRPLLPITGYLHLDQALHITDLHEPCLDRMNASWSCKPRASERENLSKAAVLKVGFRDLIVCYFTKDRPAIKKKKKGLL